ncbi:hypothetical protein [Cohnella rhizosphaerae]|uniref:Uncharacterized protein n=1 Tax=Cohnella rhizosphaerae TaxID=1457232 RepID=A0A9X4QUL0_9BACL|nr:hypothetical protein [Cohnella rhizosphaerae]MDG0811840.1 hypothetical protein [Cohnella rhizosphaerae]
MNEKAKNNDMISRSLRWVVYDEALSSFEYVYIGDIDVFICKEENDLCEMHAIHCCSLGLAYSNCVRGGSAFIKKPLKQLVKNFLQYGFRETSRMIMDRGVEIDKLSGLHFVKTKEYFNKVIPLQNKYIEEFNHLANKKSKRWNLCYFNDEAVLYELVNEAKLGLPPKPITTSNEMILNQDPKKVEFRPHHGLHLGIWRNDITQTKSEINFITESDLYRSYYFQFCDNRNNDIILNKILEEASPYIKNIISNMDKYYNFETENGK